MIKKKLGTKQEYAKSLIMAIINSCYYVIEFLYAREKNESQLLL